MLKAVLQRTDLSEQARVAALESAAAIESDFEAATVPGAVREDQRRRRGGARAVLPRRGVDRLGVRAQPRAAGARRADRTLSEQTVLEILRSAQGITSAFERAQVLLAVAGTHPLTREARDVYIDAADKLGDFEQGRVLSALVRNESRK